MVKLKNEVTGFIYESCHGYVKNIFTKPQTQIDIDVINMFIDEDDVLFTDNEDINNMFEFECKEDLENNEEGLNKVLEWVE